MSDEQVSNDKARANTAEAAFLRLKFLTLMNAASSRLDWIRQAQSGERDIRDSCKYPPGLPTLQMYQDLYDFEPFAYRTVRLMPMESWKVLPEVIEDDDPDTKTPFEQAWDALGTQVRGEQSWHADDQGSPVWEALKRADIQSGIGSFGLLLLGLDDGKRLDQPVAGAAGPEGITYRGMLRNERPGKDVFNVDESKLLKYEYPDEPFHPPNVGMGVRQARNVVNEFEAAGPSPDVSSGTPGDPRSPTARFDSAPLGTDAQYVGVSLGPDLVPPKTGDGLRLTFLRVYPETLVQVVQYEANLNSPRFGRPVMYLVTLNDPRETHGGVGLSTATVRVHWSRVIHVADNLGSSEVFGVPRQRPVFHRLLDSQKMHGGSAEMYWRGAFPGISLETIPQLGGDVDIDSAQLKEMMQAYGDDLQRYIALKGMTAQSLAPQVSDPTPQVTIIIQAICIALECPVRVFMGSERGELASSQDDENWNDRVEARRDTQTTPRLIVPFVDRLISIGVLPEPPPGYRVKWPSLSSQSAEQKAGVAATKTSAIAQYVGGDLESIIEPKKFLTIILGLDDQEADALLARIEDAAGTGLDDPLEANPELDGPSPTPPTPGAVGGLPDALPAEPGPPGGPTPQGLPGSGQANDGGDDIPAGLDGAGSSAVQTGKAGRRLLEGTMFNG